MNLRAKTKPNINELNKILTKLERKGWYSYRQNIKERAFIFKLRQKRAKS